MRDEPIVLDVGDWIFSNEHLILVAADIELLPPYFNFEVLERFFVVFNVESPVLFVFFVPRFRIFAYASKLLPFLLIQRIRLVVVCIRNVQLLEATDSVVLQHVAQIVDMVYLADLLNLVNLLGVVECHIQTAYRK